MNREALILELAHEVGFDLAGIAPLRAPRAADKFGAWLDAGLHGSMEYLERNRDRIRDPRTVMPTGRSIVVVGLAHSRAAVELPGGGQIARYAAGREYHTIMQRKLRKLARRLRRAGLAGKDRRIVDAGPILERSHAAEAGLGFESKAANLLHPQFGPWFFLGEMLLELDLEPTDVPAPGSCGTCTACIDACPTEAIREPGVVDARRCISYQTIENRGPISPALRPAIGGWAFGCDVCSQVCPWGHETPDLATRFGTHRAVSDAGLVEWLSPTESFHQWLEGSPLKRASREGLARNAAIALGNLPSDRGRHALLKALSFDPAALVREAAAWSLARAHASDAGVVAELDLALQREPDEAARAAMRAWREPRA